MGVGTGGTAHNIPGLKNRKTFDLWCRDGGFSQFRQLVIHRVDLIVHRPSGGIGTLLRYHAFGFVELAIDSWLEIVSIDESDGLMEVLGAMKELRWVIVEISALIVISIVAEGLPSHGMYIYVRIILLHRSFPCVNLHYSKFLVSILGTWDVSGEAIVFGVCFFWNFIKCRAGILPSGWGVCLGLC
jgi:hypothetical protein